VRAIKKAYLARRCEKRLREKDILAISELHMKKKGRLLFLGKKLNDAVQEYLEIMGALLMFP